MTKIEEERRRCFVRWILAYTVSNGKKEAEVYFKRIEKRHGEQYASKLKDECREQWKLGNRGQLGDWRTS